ncbi:PDZ domain-containing protein [Candidatus Peregrinibacteria bacterium]|jgi:carboxyl-terminal processing protease|nr:PDZ domain-containing protein [Candidatus Peregrinibacteria bacterium]MBT4632161.1 PDZ domain-containing protein [Candidatus Peregrinibacteria bacterium]MBT5517208.1 PDZ domain-containing protein [Candidatus Peregrinibacteria bacterium]MBT5824079.1 PDZ domain-containing protein [Candidatus Peregrinibacteria bacterium]
MKKLLLGLIISLISIPFAAASDFQSAIEYLELVGAIDTSKEFHEEKLINRAALFKITFRVAGENGENDVKSNYNDVPADAWFAPYAALAKENNLLNSETFEAERAIRRVDALNILLKAYGMGSQIVRSQDRYDLFSDVKADYPLYDIIKRAVDNGILSENTAQKFRPNVSITRGEFADLIFQFEQDNNLELASEEELFHKSGIFADIWNRINNDLYLPSGTRIDPDALFQAAIKGMLLSLDDKYTTYFSEDENQIFTGNIEGDYQGIGVYVDQDPENLEVIITDFVEGSPAKELGVEKGDIITHVDGIFVGEMQIETVVSRIRGAEGTDVQITILRDHKELDFNITRKALVSKSETGEIIENNVWYIDVNTFASQTPKRLDAIFAELESEVKRPKAIVLDFRGNVGGYVNAANYISGLFLDHLEPLMTFDYGGTEETLYNGDFGPYQDYPLYIFVDGLSASASEIVTSTLQATGNATVIGHQTYGKGTAQQIINYWDGSGIKLTIAEWLNSERVSIQEVGVTPDIMIDGDEDELWFQKLSQELR